MSELKEIRIVDIVGSGLCVASEDGEKVFDAIAAALRADTHVRLSFEEVTDLTSAFLNSAIGQLYGQFSEEKVRTDVTVGAASQDDLHLLKRVVERAKEFFKDSERFEKAATEVLGDDGDV
jgi:hypothetical protein